MADVQFEEEQQYQPAYETERKPFMVRLVLSTGIVSTDKQAEYVLLGIAALAIILAFIAPSFIGGGSPKLTPEDRQRALTAPGMNPPSATKY